MQQLPVAPSTPQEMEVRRQHGVEISDRVKRMHAARVACPIWAANPRNSAEDREKFEYAAIYILGTAAYKKTAVDRLVWKDYKFQRRENKKRLLRGETPLFKYVPGTE